MKVDFKKKSPQDFFFAPGQDDGLQFVSQPNWMWRPVQGGRIVAYAASDQQSVNSPIESHINTHFNQRHFENPIEINSVPVVLSDVEFQHPFTGAGGKWILNRASGTRLRNKYYLKNLGDTPHIDHDVMTYFGMTSLSSKGVPSCSTATDQLDFVIECRNTFNFYHFLSETLGQLCAVDEAGFGGRILIHSPSEDVKPFVTEWVSAVFPDLLERVTFLKSPHCYARAGSALNLRHFYFQTNDAVMPSLDDIAPKGWIWQGRKADRQSQAVLAMNSFDANLQKLRERALEQAKQIDVSGFPKRIYVARKDGGPRDRRMKGQAALLKQLAPMRFETIYFEDLAPLEQVAIVNNAEVMFSIMGLGLPI